MPIFLNLRVRPAGGEVAEQVAVRQVTIEPGTGGATDCDFAISDFRNAVLGKNILLLTHGFNVNQLDGYKSLSNWAVLLQLDDTWLFIGIVWPGDSSWLGPLCYPGEGKNAIDSGNLLGPFLMANLAGAASVSLVSHSLGARFILQTVTAVNSLDSTFLIEQVAIMAGAINHDCLTGEYSVAAQAIEKISILASVRDEVLAAAFPIGNIFEGIIDSGHPWFQSALGHKGPKKIPTGKPTGRWQIPVLWDFGHGSYLKLAPVSVPRVVLPQDIPDNGDETPPPYELGHESSWTAAFITTRLR